MVSQLEILDQAQAPSSADDYEGFKLVVTPAEGQVCERCRGIYPSVGSCEQAPTLCQRCAQIVIDHFPEVLQAEED